MSLCWTTLWKRSRPVEEGREKEGRVKDLTQMKKIDRLVGLSLS